MATYSVLELKNFRSYKDYSFELSDNVNIVVGPNASGKTNLLEALYVLNRARSYRAAERDIVHFGRQWFRINGRWGDHERSLIFKIDDGATSKELVIDGTTHKRPRQNKLIPTTLFDPEHMRLISGSPERRRTFMDNLIEQLDEAYGSHLRRYKRAVSQRNKLLKTPGLNEDHLFVWDLKIAEHGSYIHQARSNLINEINKLSSEIYSQLAQRKSQAKFVYSSSVEGSDYQSKLLKSLHQRHNDDLIRGFTTLGPHREDFQLILNKHEAQSSASRGETRTAVLMAKVMELKLLEEHTGTRPLLLLDDVFSELDGSRRRALTEFLKPYQTLITTTDADAIIKRYLKNYSIIPLQS